MISLVIVGRWALPAPDARTLGTGPDVQIFLWGLRWWPYALGHGLDPLVSHVIWAPRGSDVLWTTTVPLLSLLAAPVTLTLGPTVAWNLLCVLAPALSAWAAFLLCRELTGRWAPSVVGGALFGFSSYELAEGMAHLQLTMLPCVPLAAWVVVRHLHGRFGIRGLAVRVAAVAVAQFLISPEVLMTLLLGGAAALVSAAAMMPRLRPQLRTATAGVVLGAAGAGVILAPLLIAMVADMPSRSNAAVGYSADLANLVIPTRVTAFGSTWARPIAQAFSANASEQTAYLGVPLLAILLIALVGLRLAPRARLLAVLLGLAVLFSLGGRLQVAGHAIAWLPGAVLRHVPVLDDAEPARLAAYTALLAGIVVALWLSDSRSRPWRWLAVAVALAALAPNPAAGDWSQSTPAAIADGAIARIIPRGADVISLPIWDVADRGLYAQEAADMRFDLVDSWLQVTPASYQGPDAFMTHLAAPALAGIHTDRLADSIEAGFCRLHVNYALVWSYGPRLLAGLQLTPKSAGGELVYRLPTCPDVHPRTDPAQS